MVHDWAAGKGFELLPEKQFASKSLTCVRNNLNIDLAGFVNTLREQRRISIDGGYGKMKGKTFRISNMGDETTETITHLLSQIDEVIADFLPA
jgi:aspartate aminotransferase-like enzyme